MFAQAGDGDQPFLMVTTETVPGYVIERVLGLVVGSSSFSLEGARRKAVRQAEQLGANALLAARFAGGSGGSFSGTVFYGTAVVIRPESNPSTRDRRGSGG
jgi:uncharacterized protein YbjQ (UPF0145 family)